MDTSKHQLAMALAELLRSKGAEDIVLLHVSGLSDYTDYLLIATGSSTTTVRALSQYAIEWAQQHKQQVLGREGMEQPEWILLDFGSVVLHLFLPEARQFYAIESLWLDAPRLALPSPTRTGVR